MINDWYQAVIDITASQEEAKNLAIEVTSVLATEKIITLYKPGQTLTHISGKFAPGPDFSFASGAAIDLRNHQELNIGGMDIHTKAWVNDYGIIGLDSALCPVCKIELTTDSFDLLSVLKESFAEAGENFVSRKHQPRVSCPNCKTSSHVSRWKTQPHLGFCSLAFIFWNWPPFESWRINIPEIISQTLGRDIILTYGRL
ncbi:MAG: hypothetical protein ACRBBN_03195 [Methyloligellaceae bacterium]